MRSLLFTSIFFLSSIFAVGVHAQEESKNLIDQILEAGGVIVADVRIDNPTITAQNGNEIDISFTFSNKGEQQSGVMYGVQLVKEEKVGNSLKHTIVHEVIYPEELVLATNSNIEKNIKYIAPNVLTGQYVLHINSKNKQGFPFSSRIVGNIDLQATNTGLFIDANTCILSLGVSSEGGESENSSIKCMVENILEDSRNLVPDITVRKGSSFGEEVEVSFDKESITFNAKDKKAINIKFNGISKPGMYFVDFGLIGDDADSNRVVINEQIPGSVVSIVNASLEKDIYQKGEIAKVKILWSGNVTEVNAKVKIKSNGRSRCAAEFNGPVSISNESPFSLIEMEMNKKCVNPTIEVEFSDTEGNVLDSQEFGYKTLSEKVSVSLTNYILALIAIIALSIIAFFAKKAYIKQ